jgi:hypothetical protein
MSDYTSAFTAPFQIVENRNKRTDKSPTHSIVFNFTLENALAASDYFKAMAQRADAEGTVCTVWNKDTKSADEFPGFAMWASCWGKSGRLSPPAIESSQGSKELPF